MNEAEPGGLRVTLLATLWLVVLALAATAPALFGDRSLGPESMLDRDPLYARGVSPPRPSLVDLTRFFFDIPRDFAAADGFLHGRVDFWNPRVGFGIPLWGEGGGLFFPAKFPFYLWPSRRTYDLAATLRLVIAGVGAFLLARRRGLASVPAVAAGSLFELSGAIVATLPFGSAAPPCVLPWTLLGAEVIAQRRRLAAAAATGLALGVAASSGHPMLAAMVFAGFGAAICGHALAAWRQPRTAFAIGALAILAVVLGLAMAAPALLPVLETWGAGRLYKGTPVFGLQRNWYRIQSRAALPIALFAPASLLGLREGLSIGFPYALVSPVMGLLGLVFAVAGVLRRGLDNALLAVLLLGLGLTLAPPVLAYIGQLPLLSYVYPMYAWALVALPLTQAAGRGIEALSLRQGRLAVLAALAVVLAGASSLTRVADVAPGTVLAFPARKIFVASLDGWSGWLALVLPLTLLPLVVVALVLGARSRFRDRCAIAAAVLAALELLFCLAPTTWFPDSTVLGSPPSQALRFLQQRLDGDRYRMLGWPRGVGNPATPSLFGLRDVRGVGNIPVERYVHYLEAISPGAPWYIWQFPGDVRRHPLLDLAGVRYVVQRIDPGSEPEPLIDGDAALRLAYRDERVAIYENEAALPRARIVHSALLVHDPEEAFQRISEAAGAGPHATPGLVDRVFVERSADGHAPPPETLAGQVAPGLEDVQIVGDDDPDEVELRATLSAPGWVVLADTFYPGWTATIDGDRTPIHPTDLLFRGVFVPAGTHRIVFRYQPTSVRVGLALAAFGLAVSGLLLIRKARPMP